MNVYAPQIKDTSKVGVEHGVKVIVYGKAGAGKTTLAATCPKPIIFSAESGLLSLRKHQLPYVEVSSLDVLTSLHQWCLTDPSAKRFETIVIDSISEIGEVVLNNAKLGVKDPRQAYGILIEQMGNTIRAFRDLKGFNVVMMAKEHKYTNGDGIDIYGPSMPGKQLPQDLPYFPDEVFQLDIGKDNEGNSFRYLRTAPDFNHEAKDRSGCLETFEAPDLGAIIAKIKA